MSDALSFDRSFDPNHGQVVEVRPGIRRVVAPNTGPFTFTGTNSFIVGRGDVALIDPGPLDDGHRAALENALAGERLTAIIVTHTHRDHSPLARPIAEAHDAPVYGFGPHTAARPPLPGEDSPGRSGGDTAFRPDVVLADGHSVAGSDWELRAVHTPGHTENHICLALEGTGILFSGDHVMAWSTTVVSPPDGSMSHYMESLERLRVRQDDLYLPAHGGEIANPKRFVRALAAHRRQRERAIIERLKAGDSAIPEIVAGIYAGLDPRLIGAAGASVLAHLEYLVARGEAVCDGVPTLKAHFRPA
jgi:glyoxylase-like metal-dependent hydrolase (beta-lactamase superfamily II)